MIALVGGTLYLVCALQSIKPGKNPSVKVFCVGKYLFAAMLIIFGFDHFLYADLVKNLVPGWIPEALAWTYLTGGALIGAGISLVIAYKVKLTMYLLAFMLFTWALILHAPIAIQSPFRNGEQFISLLECVAFCGIALLIAGTEKREKLKSEDSK